MVDIRDFFGTPKNTKKPKKRPAIALEDHESDDVVELKEPKIQKTAPKKAKRKEPVVEDADFIDSNDSNDPEGDDFPEELLISKKPKAKAEEKQPTKPVKASTSPKKPRTKPSTGSPTKEQHASGATAIDVLSTIPDAELPEDVPTGEGFNYHAFKARQETLPVQSGGIEIPEGAPNCLTGLTMVFTGVLPNITRDECENIAKKYGAKVTKSISSKTSVVVLGEEAGPSKVRKIKQFKIKAINEDGFIQLIKGMPEEGGSGAQAERAKLKREQEEQKIIEESEKLAKQQDIDNKTRKESIAKAKQSGNISSLGKLKSDDEKLWTVKYAPTDLNQICGNKSSVNKLKTWLENWPKTFGSGKPGKNETEMRAVLIHGPPGIGKTTAAHLVAKALGYDVLEQNASDVRSKSLLNAKVANALNNTSVMGYFNAGVSENKDKFVLIMDEVDGMSGGDRGGVGQLASFCRKTQAPLILICNDKSLPKMRPFDRVTLDIPFRRPAARELKSRLMTIALREHIKLDPNIIDKLVAATSNDIRQIINLLSTVSKTQASIDSSNSNEIAKSWQKNIALKPFDIIPRLLNGQLYLPNSTVPLYKKMEYYFDDHAFVPLMLQENYLSTRPLKGDTKTKHLELVSQAADSISLGDLVDKKIHSSDQQWSLMPLHAIMSTVRPASLVAGNLAGRVNFTSWLGQNSKAGKYYRLLTEIHYRSRLRTSTDQVELRLEYVPVLVKRLLNPLLADEPQIDSIIEILDYYYLSKVDWDALMELVVGEDATQQLLKKVPAKVKSKFTRSYNAKQHPISVYKPGLSTAVSEPTKDIPDNDEAVEEEDIMPE